MVRLRKSCCCSLRTGAFVIGYFHIASTVLSLISTAAHLASQTYMDDQLKTTIIATLAFSCVTLLLNSLMVYGVHEGKPGFLIAWLGFKLLALVGVTILLIISSGQVLLRGAEDVEYVIIFVVIPLALALAWYLFLVVYSHYRELCDGPSHSRLQNKHYFDDQIAIISEK